MRARTLFFGLLCLLCVVGVWFLWQREHGRHGSPSRPHQAVVPAVRPQPPSSVASSRSVNTNAARISLADWNTNKFAGRLSNTTKTIGQLTGDSHAILLANALIDTTEPFNFVFPKNLQPQGDPGAYIVQANGPVDNAFRALLAQAGATIVAYIPNDAYLVRASKTVATILEQEPPVQAVVPYEPYYKIQSPLLPQAVEQMQLPDNTILNLGLFADAAPATVQQIEKLGGQVVGRDQSPFGPVVRVQLPPLLAANWTTLATLSGVQIVEPYHKRVPANDLSRATVGVAANSLTATNYLSLTGTNIIVEVNDTGIDAQHPDLTAGGNYNKILGVIGDAPQSLVDTNGHGTHVAGIIAGDGEESTTVTNAPGSILNNGKGTNYQFRGMAPGVTLYSVGGIQGGSDTNIISDQYFQQVPALTNALISNNSWVNEGDNAYDLAAASYDAAVRDALPTVTGSQPVLFVFAAGNAGNGNDSEDLGGGIADSIESPATAKDVITVGALQEYRNITNTVTNAVGTVSAPWQPETSTSYRVAGFSSRGNVGIGTEGTYGRYKPDVAAPGTFIVSTRSEQWDIGTYFYQDPTNNQIQTYTGITVQPGLIFKSTFPSVPNNATQVTINTYANANSPYLFAFLPIYVALFTTPSGWDFYTTNGAVSIPPDGGAGYLQSIISSQGFLGGFYYAVSNNTANPVTFDLLTDVITTNGTGNELLVLSNLDESIGTPNNGPVSGPWYRYETGTSMSCADVSGVLALMQQFYAVAYHALPSPAMLKAMLINGAQATGFYDFQVQNPLNYEGWGLVNLPDSLPPGVTNTLGLPCTAYLQDQNPTNALATGDSQTFYVSVANAQPLRVTLAWTDPPGDPAAAIKLVNNLTLVVTNLSNPTNIIVYYGNDIGSGSTYNNAESTNTPPVFDSINNVQNVYLPPGAGTYSVTVLGYRVNVNAVTAQTNNVVQDYALVISAGNGQATNGVMTVSATPAVSATPPPVVSNPTGDQQITYPSQTSVGNASAGNAAGFSELLNQFVGANTPLLGTNTIPFTTNAPEGFGPDNWQVTVGMTNQWHFYVVTNTFGYSNAAFITFIPNTLSVPRMGVFADSQANATTPEADIDLYVSTSPGLTNLDPTVISNCVLGTQVGAAPGPSFFGASLSRGGTEFVADTNSQSRTPSVYYIGVKSETQMASEYGFLSIFTQTPFSQMNNGNQVVNGVPLPVYIPDGTPAVPGYGYVFGLALYPMQVGQVTVSDAIWHQNFGDLIGTLTLNGGHPDVLNNHDSLGSPPNPPGFQLTYDDNAGGGVAGSRPSDGPGSLNGFIGLSGGPGVWMLSEVDDSLTQTGYVAGFTLTIQPHQNGNQGISTYSVPPNGWAYDYVDVPPGATNLTVYATNLTLPPGPLELFVKFGSEPTLTNSDEYGPVLFGGSPPAAFPYASISVGPPLTSGRYFFGLYNPGTVAQTNVQVQTVILPPNPSAPQTIYSSSGPVPILDDAVTTNNITVPDNQIISSLDVAIAVQHPRISDLVFHLISPDGTRDLLMENRGGTSTNGAGGISTVTTNVALASSFDTAAAGDYASGNVAGWTVAGNQVSVQTDPANAYPGNNNLLALANGTLSTTLTTVPGQTYTLTFAYRGPDAVGWWRGENNANDIINNNVGTLVGPPSEAYYTNGVVGSAFSINVPSFGPYAGVDVPDIPAYALTNSLSIEGWIRPRGDGWIVLWRGDNRPGLDPYTLSMQNSPLVNMQVTDAGGNTAQVESSLGSYGPWHHVAGTMDGNSGMLKLYVDGNLVAQTNTTIRPFGTLIPTDHPGVGVGNLNDGQNNFGFFGDLDEISLYSRALSASEVQAIYADGTNGKFDPTEFLISPPQSLAEAQVSINGGAPTAIFGNNTAWQTQTISFTAIGTATALQIQGIEPGMLLGAASVVSVTTNYNYLVFTENTNLTTTPIKFAVPPFVAGTNSIVVWQNGFEESTGVSSTPTAGQYFSGGWLVDFGSVDVLASGGFGNAYQGNYFIDLDGSAAGGISTNIATVPGQTYTLSFAYTRNSLTVGGIIPQAEILINGNPLATVVADLTNSIANLDWQTTSFVFTATSPLTHLAFHSLDPPSDIGGVYLDAVALSIPAFSEPYYQPEQALDEYDGLSAAGTWTLEIQDDRVGATNPPPQLLSWQLRFNYVTYGTNANVIPPGTTATNVIQPGGWKYYTVNVPNNADVATNILVFATGPLDMWFNPATPPPPGNNLLLGGVTSGSSTLSTFSVPTNIVPGGVYYIGLYNPNAFAVTNGFQVNFHYFQTTPLPPGVPVTNVVTGTLAGDGVNYYSVAVPANADYATNLLLSSTTPVNVWFNQNKAPVGLTPPDYLLIANATNGVAILSASSTPPLVPGSTYYLAIQNTNGPDATNVLEVDFHYASILTNGVPVTNSVPTNSFVYYPVTVPTNADYATNLLLFATAPVNVWFNQTTYPVGTNPPDYLLIPNATNGVSILSASTTPPLVPGSTYYLGIQNTNAVPVNFGLQVNFHYVVPQPIISGLTITATNNGVTNGFLLTWGGPTNYLYTIQWTTNLAAPVVWNTVLHPVINVVVVSTNGHYSWFDDGSLTSGWPPFKFYRVLANLITPPIPSSMPVTNNIAAGSITPLTVAVPASAILASNVLVSATGPVNVYFNPAYPPTGNTNAGDVLMLSAATGGSFLLTTNSLPPLAPGANYYLGVQNPGASNVTFVFQVDFAYAPAPTNLISISRITYTNIGGTNGVLLTWFASTNDLFQIQWTTSLASPVGWTTIPGVVLTNLASFTPTNGIGEFQYFDNGLLTGGFGPLKFYRLIAYPPGAAIPPALVISGVLATPGGLQIQWHGSTNYLYDVQWTTNLALPVSSWVVISNLTIPVPLAYTNGVFTYTATNALTAGSAPAEFFRVLLLP